MSGALDPPPAWRHAALVLLALATAFFCWLGAGLASATVGTEAFWPFDRLLAVFAGLAAFEAVMRRVASKP